MEISNVCCIGASHVDCAIMTVDLKFAERCANQVHVVSKSDIILVKKSTLPLRIAQTIKNSLSAPGNGAEVQISPILDFLVKARDYVEFHFFDRVLICGENREGIRIATRKY